LKYTYSSISKNHLLTSHDLRDNCGGERAVIFPLVTLLAFVCWWRCNNVISCSENVHVVIRTVRRPKKMA